MSRRERALQRVAAAAAFCTGVLLATVQFALFFELQARLSSSSTTYLVVTVVWLVGAVAALRGRRSARGDLLLLAAAAIAAPCLHVVLLLLPFDDRVWFVAPWCIGIGGYAAGAFLRCNQQRFTEVRWLLFWENNGFVAGIPAGLAVLTLGGTRLLLGLPLGFLGCVLLARMVLDAGRIRTDRRAAPGSIGVEANLPTVQAPVARIPAESEPRVEAQRQ